MSLDLKQIVYSASVIEFVTVVVQFCSFLENSQELEDEEVIDKLTKMLPLLYLKAILLPDKIQDDLNDELLEITVTEDSYNFIRDSLNQVMGEKDTYLEVFMQEMIYSDTPIAASISEDIADIYQDIKNFVSVYEYGIIENMHTALLLCQNNFKNYWGQKLVNVLRALHMVRFATDSPNLNDEEDVDYVFKEDELC